MMPSVSQMPQIASTLFSTYASFAAFLMLVRSLANDLIPHHLQSYINSFFCRLFTHASSSTFTLTIDELFGYSQNQIYEAAEIYLRTKTANSSARHLKVSKSQRQRKITTSIVSGEEIIDYYDDMKLKWRYACDESQTPPNEKRYFELSFNMNFKDKVLSSYLPYVLQKADASKQEDKVVKLYNRECPYDDEDGSGGGMWGSINLEHPSTFQTLAMDPEVKKMVVDDLDRFLQRKEFYKKVGRAWKRGYLLYGPPGTGKSSLIAAMANYLRFNIYDLDLASVSSNSELKRILLSTTNRSILVIEDIDCNKEARDRQNIADEYDPSISKMTLSVFTTNHKDRLDPALLRPGRMDMHIHMSYCSPYGFKTLASNYLGVSDHPLFGEIEALIESSEISPAQVAEELMKNDDADVALEGLIQFIKRKKMEGTEIKDEKTKLVDAP
ncbi:ATP binding protein, putative [Ricinus communis]|uniref:ATP binding protein, putative n=1 Tax=Ricinus communis TaxID=3988 RepID=B9S6B1_RICCO|nr:ATP binding protein, putative [Ricinus communis]